jgi:hypothetical protein
MLRINNLNAGNYIGYNIQFKSGGINIIRRVKGVTPKSIILETPIVLSGKSHNSIQSVNRRIFLITSMDREA